MCKVGQFVLLYQPYLLYFLSWQTPCHHPFYIRDEILHSKYWNIQTVHLVRAMFNKRDNTYKLISSFSLLWSTEIKYQISVCCLAWIKYIAMILQQKVVGLGFTNYLFLKEAYTHKYKSYRYNCEIFMACSWYGKECRLIK